MAINYRFELDNKTLNVFANGKDENLEEVMAYGQAILEYAISHDCNKILCDERNLEYALSTVDTYELAKAASEAARAVGKIAVVCNKKYLDNGEFFETVAVNRGLIVFVTADYEKAIEWIK